MAVQTFVDSLRRDARHRRPPSCERRQRSRMPAAVPVFRALPRRRLQQSGEGLLDTRVGHRLFAISGQARLRPLQVDVV